MSEKKKTGKQSEYEEILVKNIQNNPNQPRKFIDEESLTSLQESIKEKGVIQPILVQKQGDAIILVAGQRRLLAAKELGLETIPAIYVSGDAQEIALIENLQREDLHPIDKAISLNDFMEIKKKNDKDFNQEKISLLVGMKQNTLSEFLTIAKLPKDIQKECTKDTKNNKWSKKILLSIARKKSKEKMKEAFEKAKEKLEGINKQEKPKQTKGEKLQKALIKRVENIKKSFTAINTVPMNAKDKKTLTVHLESLQKELADFLAKMKG